MTAVHPFLHWREWKISERKGMGGGRKGMERLGKESKLK